MSEENVSTRSEGLDKLLKAGKPVSIVGACLLAFSTFWMQLDGLRKELSELNSKMVFVTNNKEAITRLENLFVKHIDGPLSHPEVEAKLLLLISRVESAEKDLKRLEPKVNMSWTESQQQTWASKLQSLNPTINVP